MAKPYRLPVIQKDASGNLQRATTSHEEYLAYQAGLRFAERGNATPHTIQKTITYQADSAIGSFTDTFYNEAVGTHPGTSLSTGSTTTTLYQRHDSDGNNLLDDQSSGLFRRPVYESDGNIFDMDSDAMHGFAEKILGLISSEEYPGAQRLGSAAPSGDWEVSVSNVFEDTTTDGTVTTYNIYERKTGTAPTKCNAMHTKRASYGAFPLAAYDGGLEAMTDSEMSMTFGQIASRYFRHGAPGTYELRSSAQGVPTRTGTWEARGTAVDTRYTTSEQQYAGQYTGYSSVQYAGTRVFSGSRNYVATYTASENFTVADVDFVGTRGANYTGQRVNSFVGTRDAAFAGNTGANYAGVRSFVGERSFTVATDFLGVTPANYTGNRTFTISQAFGGVTPANYAGVRNFLGTTPAQFAGTRNFGGVRNFAGQRSYTGSRNFTGARNFGGTRSANFATTVYQSFARNVYFEGPQQNFARTQNFNGPMPANFAIYANYSGPGNFSQPIYNTYFYVGTRSYASWRQFSGSRIWQFTGIRNFTGPRGYLGIRNYTGGRTTNYLGSRSSQFGGNQSFGGAYGFSVAQNFSSPGNFAGTFNFAGVTPQNYAGTRNFLGTTPANYTGVRSFTGGRAFGGTTPANYAGVRGFTGERTFTISTNFAGFTGANYTGPRPATFTALFTAAFAGFVESTFVGPRVFAGVRGYAGSRNYTANYTGTIQFAGNYTNQYTTQYTGDTLTDTSETIETYTLYVRVE